MCWDGKWDPPYGASDHFILCYGHPVHLDDIWETMMIEAKCTAAEIDQALATTPSKGFGLDVTDITARLTKYVSPAAWDALPVCPSTLYMMDVYGPAGGMRKHVPVQCLCAVVAGEPQEKHYQRFGQALQKLLEVRKLDAKLCEALSLPVALGNNWAASGAAGTFICAYVHTRESVADLNAFLGEELFVDMDRMSPPVRWS